MSKMDFKIVHEPDGVSIVRTMSSSKKSVNHVEQRMRVLCFDSKRIDNIFHIQENSIRK